MSFTHIGAEGAFAFRLIDETGACVASTTITGPREAGLSWAEHQVRQIGLQLAVLQRQLHTGTWFAVAKLEG